MQWQEIRARYPQKWRLVEVINAHTQAGRRNYTTPREKAIDFVGGFGGWWFFNLTLFAANGLLLGLVARLTAAIPSETLQNFSTLGYILPCGIPLLAVQLVPQFVRQGRSRHTRTVGSDPQPGGGRALSLCPQPDDQRGRANADGSGSASSTMNLLDAPQSTQLVLRPGIIELNWGQPDPALLPVEAIRRAALAMLDQAGRDALSYGAAAGAGTLMACIRDRVKQTEGQTFSFDEIVITAGNSDALDQICTLFTQPGDVALVESPTYHLALRIMNDHALSLIPVPVDEAGLQVELLAAKVKELKGAGRRVRMLYTIPTYHNPTGVNLHADRRRALVELAAAEDFVIVEDDVYRELTYDGPSPASLWSIAPRGVVLRMGSFAKSLAPGLRLGWLNGSATQMSRIADSGLRDSGGGVNHFAAMVVASLCESGDFEEQVIYLQNAYRQRRDTLSDALAEFLPPDCSWTKPGGGFFIWVTLPEGMDAAEVLGRAEEAGMAFIPGVKFCLDGGGRRALRLAFSLYPPDQLAEAAQRLGKAIRPT